MSGIKLRSRVSVEACRFYRTCTSERCRWSCSILVKAGGMGKYVEQGYQMKVKNGE